VVDDMIKKDPTTGQLTHVKFNQQQLTNMQQLVKNAVGFNAARGDSVNVVNASFVVPEVIQPSPEPPIWEQHWFWMIMKTGVAGLFILLLVMLILKPVMRSLVTKQVDKKPLMFAGGDDIDFMQNNELDPETQVMITAGELHRLQQQSQWNKLRQIATDDPRRIAQVMRTWVGDD